MKNYKSLLFDLDGTITDSSEGIINSIQYALNKMNICVRDRQILNKFVGPPLMDSYKLYFGLDDTMAYEGLILFREYFERQGMYENKLYDGIYDLLYDLKASDYDILLATSKPKPYAIKILEYFKISGCFNYIAGCPMEEKDVTKADVINDALHNAITKDKSEIVMIGDTKFDTEGAKQCGIDSIAVLYGMGEEKDHQNATYIVKTVDELYKLLLR